MPVLVDTNILSELTRLEVNAGLAAWARRTHVIAVSVVTVEEIEFGLRWKPNARIQRLMEGLLSDVVTLEVTREIAEQAGRMRGALRSLGSTRTAADMVIAATALVHGMTLVTRNERDFEGCGIVVLNPFSD